MSISLILLGAGNSTRFGMAVKKQWLRIGSEPLWLYVSKKISSYYKFDKIIFVANPNEANYMKRFCNFNIIHGGKTRQKSLINALKHVDSKYVLVSDIARANISKKLLLRLIGAKDEADCIIPTISAVDTIYFENEPIDREQVYLVQTPQLSKSEILKKALENSPDFTDDSSAIKAFGKEIKFVKGSKKAVKLTSKGDLKFFKNLKKPSQDSFIGSGFDVHAFGEKRILLLGGVKIHESMGLKAHSDGDVLAHALTDAILGAISAGDIGELFPDNDKTYKNANSMKLLEQVVIFARSVGFEFVNCDITILAQKPKINPFKQSIIEKIAKTLDIKPYFVNVKASTTEELGFIGRGEGVAVHAVVSMKFYNWTEK